jgi:hypothetical protein
MTGRAVCAVALAAGDARASRRGWAPADALEVPAERGLVLHTRPAWRWASLEAARVALLAEVRAALPHRDLLPEDRAVVLGPDEDAWRLWVISPDLPTLAEELTTAALEQGEALDPGVLADRWTDAWKAVRGVLGARAEAFGPESVARTARGWAMLAFGEMLERPAPPLVLSPHIAAAIGPRLERAGAWPRAWAPLVAAARGPG